MMGIPNWNSDIGGYTGHGYRAVGVEGAKDPRFQELFVRWTQLGAFSPMMRAHGKRIPREIWNFGERGTWCFDAIEKMIKLRYRLLPYIYSTSWDVSKYDGTFMRALVMDFPDDKKTYELGGQYLFGRSILVAPVTEPSVTEWPVYLPQGADWWDFWTNEKKTGGQTRCLHRVQRHPAPLHKSRKYLPLWPRCAILHRKELGQPRDTYLSRSGRYIHPLRRRVGQLQLREWRLFDHYLLMGRCHPLPDDFRPRRRVPRYVEEPQV